MIGIISILGYINPSVFGATGETFARVADIWWLENSPAFMDFIPGTEAIAFTAVPAVLITGDIFSDMLDMTDLKMDTVRFTGFPCVLFDSTVFPDFF
jgi:hypothetical protein|nr:hypothetical protein [uncultured Lachnoclostridium sp.]